MRKMNLKSEASVKNSFFQGVVGLVKKYPAPTLAITAIVTVGWLVYSTRKGKNHKPKEQPKPDQNKKPNDHGLEWKEKESNEISNIHQRQSIIRNNEARNMFENKEGLHESIISKVLPAVFKIERMDGKEGTGFFQYTNIMVSNAHVIPNSAALVGSNYISHQDISHQGNSSRLIAKRAFYRPSDNELSPDVVIVEPVFENQSHRSALSVKFNDDAHHEEKHTFYIDLADIKNPIKFICQLSNVNKHPFIYKQKDGNAPQPGCSGAPIIEARVAIGQGLEWQFRVVGVLYARCSDKWYKYNQDMGKANLFSQALIRFSNLLTTFSVNEESRLVCAIPVIPDLQQVLTDIKHPEMKAERNNQMAMAHASRGYEEDERKSEEYGVASLDAENLVQLGLRKFEQGKTKLNIFLPKGLEKLFYDWQQVVFEGRPRVDHPATADYPEYKVKDNHSNHHIIPIADLLYLWKYLHSLDADTLKELRKQARNDAQAERKRKEQETRNNLLENYPDQYNQMWPGESRRINQEIKVWERKQLDKLHQTELKKQYGRFQILLFSLSAYGVRTKRFFAWSRWNLFKGWDGDHRSDDPVGDGKDRSEKVRPKNFDVRLWNSLKDEKTGLYRRIQKLKKLKGPKEKVENKLYSSLNNLATIWKNTENGNKRIHPFNSEEWVRVDSRDGREIYCLQS